MKNERFHAPPFPRLTGSRLPKNVRDATGEGQSRCSTAPENSPYCSCSDWHVPPRFLPTSLRKFVFGRSRTFCLVRDPLDKALSEFKMRNLGIHAILTRDQAQASADEYLGQTLEHDSRHGMWGHDCHLTPQHFYIWDEEGRRTCHDVVRYDHDAFERRFNELMRRDNYSDVV